MRGDMQPTLWQQAIIADVAHEFGNIGFGDLWSMYCDMVYANFEQDIRDVAKDNLEELEELRDNRAKGE